MTISATSRNALPYSLCGSNKTICACLCSASIANSNNVTAHDFPEPVDSEHREIFRQQLVDHDKGRAPRVMVEGADTDIGDRRPGVDHSQVDLRGCSNRRSGNRVVRDTPVELRPASGAGNYLAQQIDDDETTRRRTAPFGIYRADRSDHVEVSASRFYHRADADRILGESVDFEGCGHLRARHRHDTS